MCYPCTHCNKCGRMPQPGFCGHCGYVNDLGARVCAQCGAAFPAPPGRVATPPREQASADGAAVRSV